MENAADALKMAGAILLFVLALSIIILSFGQVRESADIILDYRDRETSYIDGNYYYEQTGKERNVNLETIVPSVFRAYLENYKIVFDGLDKPIYIIGNYEKYTLDLETNQTYMNVSLADENQKIDFLKGIVYGDYGSSNQEEFEKKFDVDLNDCRTIYEQLTDKVENGNKIIEYLGVYYQNDSEEIPDVNKTQKRVITYKILSKNN